jgi:hypothetical protein
MSQLRDVQDIVLGLPLSVTEKSTLFFELLGALDWEVDGVSSVGDAEVFLFCSSE